MKVQRYWIDGRDISVTQDHKLKELAQTDQVFRQALLIGALCNNVQVDDRTRNVKMIGDPTEVALVEAAYSADLTKVKLEHDYRLVREVPFDSERKRMTTVVRCRDEFLAYVKGAPGIILEGPPRS